MTLNCLGWNVTLDPVVISVAETITVGASGLSIMSLNVALWKRTSS
jgi:hypothetical protein